MSQYKRGSIWWVKIRHAGETIRKSSRSTSRPVAKAYEKTLREELGRLDRGGKPRQSYENAMLRFMDEHLPTLKPATRRRYEVSAKALHPHFGSLHLDQINRARVTDFIAERRRQAVSGDTIRNDLACLSSMLSCAIDWEWIEANPVQALRRRKVKAKARTRYLSHDEETRLLVAAGAYLRPMIAFAIDTGLRLEEQLSLTWDQIDMRRREIALSLTKTDRPRIVPLLERAGTILGTLNVRHLGSRFVWAKADGTRYGKLTRGLAGAARRAGIADLRWHDLRRTCGCRLLQDYGLDINKVGDWLGHTSPVVTKRSYAFLRVEDLHRAIRDGAQIGAQGTRIDSAEKA